MTTHIVKLMKAAQYVVMTAFVAMTALSCSEEPVGQTPTDSNPPSALTNVRAVATPGGAKISYTLPKETDISYVKGEFIYQGKLKVVRASVYDNFMIVEGLPTTDPVTITLWLVDHSENTSPSTTLTFTPDTPPIESIFKSLKTKPDFGGVAVTWDNPLGIEIGVALFVPKPNGEFDAGRMFFSEADSGKYVFRGLNPVSTKFGIRISDKWGNQSEILEFTATPVIEEMVDRTGIKQNILPYDNRSDNGNGQVFSRIYDGDKISTGGMSWHSNENHPLTEKGYTMPILFTLDLGVEKVLSRFILWQGRWTQDFLYSHHNPRLFEVWGTRQLATGKSDDYWLEDWKADWVKIADCEIIKPSGTPIGQLTNEDIAQANAGHEFYPTLDPVRYVRFSVKSTWIGNKDNTITIQEIEYWGAPPEALGN